MTVLKSRGGKNLPQMAFDLGRIGLCFQDACNFLKSDLHSDEISLLYSKHTQGRSRMHADLHEMAKGIVPNEVFEKYVEDQLAASKVLKLKYKGGSNA